MPLVFSCIILPFNLTFPSLRFSRNGVSLADFLRLHKLVWNEINRAGVSREIRHRHASLLMLLGGKQSALHFASLVSSQAASSLSLSSLAADPVTDIPLDYDYTKNDAELAALFAPVFHETSSLVTAPTRAIQQLVLSLSTLMSVAGIIHSFHCIMHVFTFFRLMFFFF